MGLVYRNGRPYLYRSKRSGGRVTSEYLGCGESALLMARLETIDRDETDNERREEWHKEKRLDDLERALNDLAKQAKDLAANALTAAGYHIHHRGEWRKRRGEPCKSQT